MAPAGRADFSELIVTAGRLRDTTVVEYELEVGEGATLRGSFSLKVAACTDLQFLDASGTRCLSCEEGQLVRRDDDGVVVSEPVNK